jgi:hypothetical protein
MEIDERSSLSGEQGVHRLRRYYDIHREGLAPLYAPFPLPLDLARDAKLPSATPAADKFLALQLLPRHVSRKPGEVEFRLAVAPALEVRPTLNKHPPVAPDEVANRFLFEEVHEPI